MSTALAMPEAKRGLSAVLAEQYGMEPARFLETVKATVFPSGATVTNEQLAAFLIVAKQYGLNPFTRELYAFTRTGDDGKQLPGIVPVVSIDGWTRIINREPNLDGIEFHDHVKDGELVAITCRMYRKDRAHPTEVTEYMAECYRETKPWKKWKARMLRHKALIQCARYAFSLSGIYDEDEAERIEVPSGKLELEADSTLHEMKKLPTPVASPAPVFIQVDKAATIINGNFRPIEADLPKVGARWDNTSKAWTMPAGRTHELLALCDSKKLKYVEVDAEGKPVAAQEAVAAT